MFFLPCQVPDFSDSARLPRHESAGMEEKTFKNVQQKNAVARMAAKEILDGECIYLDDPL
jgi:DeoR/GlpR family transcriptional regulator of sugar metabolism